MWRGPTGGSASRRSCGTSGGGGSGCCGSCYWLWIVGGVKWPGRQRRRTEHPQTRQGSNLSPQERQDDGGDERGVSGFPVAKCGRSAGLKQPSFGRMRGGDERSG